MALLLCEDLLMWAVKRSKATAGQFNLTLEICRDLPLPIPPQAEQSRIAEEVELKLTSTDVAAAALQNNLRRADRLRQSILKRAFEGKLVPQNPSDEPASVLLDCICAALEIRIADEKTSVRGRESRKTTKAHA